MHEPEGVPFYTRRTTIMMRGPTGIRVRRRLRDAGDAL